MAPSFSSHIYVHYYRGDDVDVGGQSVGTTVLTTETFAALHSFIKDIAKLGVPVESVLILPSGEYEINVTNPNGTGGVIFINDRQKFDVTFANLSVFLQNNTVRKSGRNEFKPFEYIDTRYGANIFYKSQTSTIDAPKS